MLVALFIRRPSLYKRIGVLMRTSLGRLLKRRAIAVATGTAVMVGLGCAILFGQGARDPDPARYAAESLQHFQALLRLNTSNPPGNEHLVTDYLKSALEKEGIPVRILALEQARPNLVARLKGNGTKRPILLMGHSDVVTVDEKKWTFPPFGATRDGGYIYGRGALDDKPSIVAALMAMLTLKRLGVPLERDVILLVESGEEGTTRVGIDYVVNEFFSEIEAEYLSRGRRRCSPGEWRDQVCVRGNIGEDSTNHRTRRPRTFCTRFRPAIVERCDTTCRGGVGDQPLGGADSPERDDARVFHAAGGYLII